MKERIREALWMLIPTVLLVGLDQVVKYWTILNLKDQKDIELWPDVFELTYVENRGAAFGMLQNQRWLFTILTLIVIVLLIGIYFRLGSERKFRLTRICCIGVLAGAIGNLIDRSMLHYVVDMFYFKLIDFPVFNVADCYVVVFGILFCLAALLQKNLLDEITGRLSRKDTPKDGSEL